MLRGHCKVNCTPLSLPHLPSLLAPIFHSPSLISSLSHPTLPHSTSHSSPRHSSLSLTPTLSLLPSHSSPPSPLPLPLFSPSPRLEFLDNLDIIAMFSSEGEKVDFSQAISTSAARGAVEKWLLQVEEVMTVSVKDVIQSAKEVRIENSPHCFIM